MRLLYLECNMGVAGDMLMSALLELHPQKEDFMRRFGQLGIPHVTAEALPAKKCGISGTHISIKIDGEEEHSHDHAHAHHGDDYAYHGEEHIHHHEHHSMADIIRIIDGLPLTDHVKTDVKNVYRLIAAAESSVHGETVEEIHFHEVGMMDAVADICGCCMLFDELKADKIMASAVNTGFGEVHCAHGIVPVPAPATALLLEGIPVYSGGIRGELATPTGAALLKYFVQEYGALPVMKIEKTGYGMGQKDFAAANCVRAMLGCPFEDAAEPNARETAQDSGCGEPAGAVDILRTESGFTGSVENLRTESGCTGSVENLRTESGCTGSVENLRTESGCTGSVENLRTESGCTGSVDDLRDNSEPAGAECPADGKADQVVEFLCCIDDMTAEEIGFAMERLLEEGALDVYAVPVTMKKSRPGTELTVLAAKDDREKIAGLIFRCTTTIGIRERLCGRRVLDRRLVEQDTEFGKIHFKESNGYGVCRRKAEYEDLKRIAAENGWPLDQARRKVEAAPGLRGSLP